MTEHPEYAVPSQLAFNLSKAAERESKMTQLKQDLAALKPVRSEPFVFSPCNVLKQAIKFMTKFY